MTNDTVEVPREVLRETYDTLDGLIERIHINGGIGPYEGGQPFIMGRAYKILARLNALLGEG